MALLGSLRVSFFFFVGASHGVGEALWLGGRLRNPTLESARYLQRFKPDFDADAREEFVEVPGPVGRYRIDSSDRDAISAKVVLGPAVELLPESQQLILQQATPAAVAPASLAPARSLPHYAHLTQPAAPHCDRRQPQGLKPLRRVTPSSETFSAMRAYATQTTS